MAKKKDTQQFLQERVFFAVLPRLIEIEKERDEILSKFNSKREREEQLEYLAAKKVKRRNSSRGK